MFLIKRLTIVLCLGLAPIVAKACFCASLGIEVEHKRSDVVFMGKLTNHSKVVFFMSESFPDSLSVFNFEVLKIAKGLDTLDNKITVLDYHHGSNCGGLFQDKNLGDTILVFADMEKFMYRHQVAVSSYCRGNVKVNNLAQHDSFQVINALPWKKVVYNEMYYYFDNPMNSSSPTVQSEADQQILNIKSFWLWLPISLLIASLVINIVLMRKSNP